MVIIYEYDGDDDDDDDVLRDLVDMHACEFATIVASAVSDRF
jgi:hypothetical protein